MPRARISELQIITRISRLAATAPDMEEYLQQVAELIKDSFDLEYARLYLLTAEQAGAWVLAAASDEIGRQKQEEGYLVPLDQETSAIARAGRSGTNVLIKDVAQEPAEGSGALQPAAGSELAVPLLAAGEIIGLFDLHAGKPNSFSVRDMEVHLALAEQVALAVQKMRFLAETEMLYNVSTRLNAASTLNELVQGLALPGVATGAVSAVLFTFELDIAGQPEWVEARAVWEREEGVGLPLGARFYLPDFPFARLWQEDSTNPLLVGDALNDNRIDPGAWNTMLPSQTGALAMLPLSLRGRWVGLFATYWNAPCLFSASQQRLYKLLASQAAVAVDNRLLFEQTQRRAAQLEKLAEIEAALSRASSETEILAALALILESDRKVRVTLNYLETDEAGRPVAARPVVRWFKGGVTADPSTGVMLSLETQPAAALWLDAPNSVLFIEDLLTDPRIDESGWTDAAQLNIRAMAVVPLRSGGRWQGTVTYTWSEPHVFTADERFVMRRLLEPAAAVVASRRAYLAEQETRGVLDSIIENVPLALFVKEVETLKIVRWNKGSENLFGFPREEVLGKDDYALFPSEQADLSIARDREMLAGASFMEAPETLLQTPHRGQRSIHTRKVILRGVDGRPRYLLEVAEDTTERKQVETTLARRAAELETVAQVSTAASAALATKELLQIVVDLTKVRFGLYHTHIYLLDETGQDLVLMAGAGEVGRQMAARDWRIPVDREQSVVARAAQERQGIIVNDVRAEPGWLDNPLLPATRSELAVPILIGGQVLGVLDVQSEVANHFTAEDARIQMILGAQVAVALQNTRQYEQTQAALAEIKQSQELLRVLLDNIPNPIFYKDTRGVYLGCNRAFLEYLGKSNEEIIGKSVYDLNTNKDLADKYHEMDMVLFRNPGLQVYEARVSYADGTLHDVIFNKATFNNSDGSLGGLVGTIIDITERKRAEEAMRRGRAELSEALSIARLAYWEFDVAAGEFTFNDQLYTLFGTTAEREGGYRITAEEFGRRFVHPDDATNVGGHIGAALQTDDPDYMAEFESHVIRGNGEEAYIAVQLKVERDEQGRPVKLYGTNQDITERKLAEEELDRQRRMFQAVLENMPTGVFVVEAPSGRPILTNERAKELLGQGIDPAATKEDLAEVYAAYRYGTEEVYPAEQMPVVRGMFGETATIDDMAIHRPDGSQALLQVFGGPVRDAAGQIVASVAIFQDITEGKRNQETLAKRAAELEAVAQVSTAASSILDMGKLLQQVVDLTKESFGLYHAHVYLLDEAGQELVLAAGAGEVGRRMVAQGWRIPFNHIRSLVARTARTQAGLIVNDVRQEPDFLPNPLLPLTRAELAVPLIAGEQLLGVLDVQADRANIFSEEDLRIQITLAAQIAVALQNAGLYQQTQAALAGQTAVAVENQRLLEEARASAQREQILRQITARVRSSIDPDVVVRTAIRELGTALGRPAFVRLGSAEGLRRGNGAAGSQKEPAPPGNRTVDEEA